MQNRLSRFTVQTALPMELEKDFATVASLLQAEE